MKRLSVTNFDLPKACIEQPKCGPAGRLPCIARADKVSAVKLKNLTTASMAILSLLLGSGCCACSSSAPLDVDNLDIQASMHAHHNMAPLADSNDADHHVAVCAEQLGEPCAQMSAEPLNERDNIRFAVHRSGGQDFYYTQFDAVELTSVSWSLRYVNWPLRDLLKLFSTPVVRMDLQLE